MPYRGQQCASLIYLLYNDDSFQVTMFETQEDHDHEEILKSNPMRGINDATRIAINRMIEFKVTVPKMIIDSLAHESESNPAIQMPKDLKQLYNHIYQQTLKGDIKLYYIFN